MLKVLGGCVISVASAAALGQTGSVFTYADQDSFGTGPTLGSGFTATVQPTGIRAEPNGARFFNVEGAANGNFASWGGIRFDLGEAHTELDNLAILAGFSAGDWTITGAQLELTQSNASFTANGEVQVLFTDEDSLADFDPRSGAPLTRYTFPTIPFTTTPVFTYLFVEQFTGFVEEHDLGTPEILAELNEQSDAALSLILSPTTTSSPRPTRARTAPSTARTRPRSNSSTNSAPPAAATPTATPPPARKSSTSSTSSASRTASRPSTPTPATATPPPAPVSATSSTSSASRTPSTPAARNTRPFPWCVSRTRTAPAPHAGAVPSLGADACARDGGRPARHFFRVYVVSSIGPGVPSGFFEPSEIANSSSLVRLNFTSKSDRSSPVSQGVSNVIVLPPSLLTPFIISIDVEPVYVHSASYSPFVVLYPHTLKASNIPSSIFPVSSWCRNRPPSTDVNFAVPDDSIGGASSPIENLIVQAYSPARRPSASFSGPGSPSSCIAAASSGWPPAAPSGCDTHPAALNTPAAPTTPAITAQRRDFIGIPF
jgi:hypothetical protein